MGLGHVGNSGHCLFMSRGVSYSGYGFRQSPLVGSTEDNLDGANQEAEQPARKQMLLPYSVSRSDEFFDTQLYSATSWTRKLEGEPLPHCLRPEAPTPRPARPGAPRSRPWPLCNHPPTLAAHPASHTNAQANLGMFSDQQLSRKTRSRLLEICLQLPGKSAENPL